MRQRLCLALAVLGGLLTLAAAPKPAATLHWHAVRPLPHPAGGMAAAVDDGHLFISGGFNGSYQWAAYSAPIVSASAGLGGWRHITSLPMPLYNHVMVTALGSLYVIGGTTNGRDTGAQNAVYRARVQQGGGAGAWARAGTLPQRLYGQGAAVAGADLYVAGGYVPDQGYATAVYSVALGQHGFTGTWRRLKPLPQPRFGLSLVAASGYLFAVGGMTQGQLSASIYAAPLLKNGAIGAWHAVRPLPAPLANAGVTVAGGWLVVAGGTTGANLLGAVATVEAAPIGPHGTLGAWTPLPALQSHLAAPVLLAGDKFLYLLGGFDGTTKMYSAAVARACPSFVPACSAPAAPAKPKPTAVKKH